MSPMHRAIPGPLVILLILTGCGGGSSSSTPPPIANSAPTENNSSMTAEEKVPATGQMVTNDASPVTDEPETKPVGFCGVDSGRPQDSMPHVADLRRDETGAILSVKGDGLSSDLDSTTSYMELASKGLYGEQAVYFLNCYRHEFRLSDPRVGFAPDSIQQDDLGFTQVRLSQQIGSIPVKNAQIVVQFGPSGAINLVQGRYLAGRVQYALSPTFALKDAEQTVLYEVGQQADLEYSGLSVSLSDTGGSQLVYQFLATVSATEKSIISVDAHSNRIVGKEPVVLTKSPW